MKKKLMACLAAVLAMTACLGITGYALSPMSATGEPPIDEPGIRIYMAVSIAGKAGSWYEAGDLIILTASVENHTDQPVSGNLWISYPDDTGCAVMSEPVMDKRDGTDCYAVDDLEPGMGVDAVLVLRAPENPEVTDWDALATFAIGENGGCSAVATGLHFGRPELKADYKRLVKDGVLDVKNVGDGGASRVKFRFLAKPEFQSDKNLGDGERYIGDGRIEIDLGGISKGGKIEKDISGLLHQKADGKNVFEIIYEDWEERAMPEENWENAD